MNINVVSMIQALDEQERISGIYLESAATQKITESQMSILLARLILEYLEFHELDRTLSVYVPEANISLDNYLGRTRLGNMLHLPDDIVRNSQKPPLT